jgi:hypothetical protein
MTWANFYLVCFGVGFVLSVVSFLGGAFRLHLPGRLHLHLPHLGHAHVPHIPAGRFPAGHVGAAHGATGLRAGASVSPFDFTTLMAFLAWFGGIGYLLATYSRVWALVGLGIATLSGLGGASIIFLFLSRVLLAHEASLDPHDYEMLGVLSRVSVPIRPGGTGEIVFSQGGARHACGARSEDGEEIAKGAEVVVTRFERGIAYVRRWDELTEKS